MVNSKILGSECVEPNAPYVECVVCGKLIKTCERKHPIETECSSDYTCPVHSDGAECADGNWVCSNECWEIYVENE